MLAILSVLIIVHEFGHFSVARLFGFQTPVFGFGLPFEPHWVVGKKWNTEFRIHPWLLGGYVAIPELGDESATSADAFGVELKPFRKFPIWQRALVAFAGVGFNMIFAYLVMLTMFVCLGQPSQSTGVQALVAENPIALNAGIKKDDELVSINGSKVGSPDDAVHLLSKHKHELVHIQVLRNKQNLTIDMTTNDAGKVGMVLVPKGPIAYRPAEGNFLDIAGQAFTRLCTLTGSMLDALGQMVGGLFMGHKPAAGHPQVNWQDMHGVVAVVEIGAQIAQQDWSQLFIFTVMISMDLAIINLFPWPALDGAHLAFMLLEAVRGRPMDERARGEITKWGFVSLIALMALIMVNDVRALLTGQLDFKSKANTETKVEDKAEPKPSSKGADVPKTDTDSAKPAP